MSRNTINVFTIVFDKHIDYVTVFIDRKIELQA